MEASLVQLQAKVRKEEIDPVRKFLEDKALENIKAMQEMAEDLRVHPVDRFDMRKYMVSLAGYSEKKTLEHTGKVQFEPLRISRGDE